MPFRQSVLLTACVLALALGSGAGARAQDDDDDDGDASAAPIVIDIDGPCTLTVRGRQASCRGVAYMVFPANHRIDFTAITDTAGWAFSGEDDENKDGVYALDLDSVLDPGSSRLEAQGRCEMRLTDDRQTVTGLTCRAATRDGEFALKASGTVAVEDGDDDDGDDGPDDDGGA